METSTAQVLKVAVDGPVATLTMDRPRQRNALSMELMGEIVAALPSCASAATCGR